MLFDFCLSLVAWFSEFAGNCVLFNDCERTLVYIYELFVWLKQLDEAVVGWHAMAHADHYLGLGWRTTEVLVDKFEYRYAQASTASGYCTSGDRLYSKASDLMLYSALINSIKPALLVVSFVVRPTNGSPAGYQLFMRISDN